MKGIKFARKQYPEDKHDEKGKHKRIKKDAPASRRPNRGRILAWTRGALMVEISGVRCIQEPIPPSNVGNCLQKRWTEETTILK